MRGIENRIKAIEKRVGVKSEPLTIEVQFVGKDGKVDSVLIIEADENRTTRSLKDDDKNSLKET